MQEHSDSHGTAPEPTATPARDPWFRRRPWLAILLINALLFLALFVVAEVSLRLFVPYNPSYYLVFTQPGVYEFPYGLLKRNSLGFPDDEFDLTSTKPRIGYFGDSVTRGLGAGHGHRITDLLRESFPEYEHWTFGSATQGIDEAGAERVLRLAQEYDLDRVIYLLNLNDILPSRRFERAEARSPIAIAKEKLKWLDALRGKSYVYSELRRLVREYLAARGVGYHGFEAAELFPGRNARAVAETAERVRDLAEDLHDLGIAFTTVLLPYEMQISAEAAETYRRLGIRWEEGFLAGSTQRALIRHFDGRVPYVDAYWAFVREGDPDSRQDNGVGEYFVYDIGGSLDWNHPNREGHRVIADFLAEKGLPHRPVAVPEDARG